MRTDWRPLSAWPTAPGWRHTRSTQRLLETDTTHDGFKRGTENKLTCTQLVMDETSMVDVPLMHALLKVLPDEAALLLVGDVDQLPLVGPGQVLAGIISSAATRSYG